jgi:hypothetical protein
VAQRTVVMLTDDIDGGEASETVTFAIDGVTYEIDLNVKNATALRGAVAPYIGAARRSGRGARVGSAGRRGRGGRGVDIGAVREWARANGHQVSDRGRISATVQDAYDAAH